MLFKGGLKVSNLMLDLKKSDHSYKCYTTSYIKILGQTIGEEEIEKFAVNGYKNNLF